MTVERGEVLAMHGLIGGLLVGAIEAARARLLTPPVTCSPHWDEEGRLDRIDVRLASGIAARIKLEVVAPGVELRP